MTRQLLGLVGSILGNMYAYTQNNPVMFTDPSGEFLISIVVIISTIGIKLLGSAAAASVLQYLLIASTIALLTLLIQKAVEEYEKNAPREYTVYTLKDENQTITYVGRVKTKYYDQRMTYHKSTGRGSPGPYISGLNY
jgi:hypothetical protein